MKIKLFFLLVLVLITISTVYSQTEGEEELEKPLPGGEGSLQHPVLVVVVHQPEEVVESTKVVR